MSWSLYSCVLRFCHAFPGRALRPRLAALLLIIIIEGCAATATTDGAASKLPLPVADLLLVGFRGSEEAHEEEIGHGQGKLRGGTVGGGGGRAAFDDDDQQQGREARSQRSPGKGMAKS